MKRGRWTQGGLLAMSGAALGQEFDCEDPGAQQFQMVGSVAVVSICGPITYRPSWFWTNYGEIKSRVRAALESPATHVVLDIGSPGGDVAGAFETSRELKELAAAKQKPLIAFTESQCASAAYALACACSKIYVTPSAYVGSVGVINGLVDQTALDKAMGLRFVIVGSGARKTDSNPHVAISDEAIAEMRSQVEQLAGLFWSWVAEARSISVDDARGYEASQFIGAKAVDARLADGVVESREKLLAVVASLNTADTAAANREAAMPAAKAEDDKKSYKDTMRAQLEEDSKSDDKDKAADAKKMLAALDGDGDDDGKKSKADGDGDGDADADADGDEEKKKKDDEAKAKALTGSSDAIARLAAENAALTARLDARDRSDESTARAAFYATRKDLPAATLKAFDSMPFAQAKIAISAIPVQKIVAPAVVTASGAQGKKSDDDRADVADLDPAEVERIDRAMGISKANDGIVRTETSLVLGNMTKAQARAHLEKLEKEGN